MNFNLNPGATLIIALGDSGGSSADITLKSSLSTVGSILVIVGIFLLIAGIVIRKKATPARPPVTPPAA
jgi:membrane protein DedA with SNARE-associated domain